MTLSPSYGGCRNSTALPCSTTTGPLPVRCEVSITILAPSPYASLHGVVFCKSATLYAFCHAKTLDPLNKMWTWSGSLISKKPEAPIRIFTHFPRSDPESRSTKGVYVMVFDSELMRLLWVSPFIFWFIRSPAKTKRYCTSLDAPLDSLVLPLVCWQDYRGSASVSWWQP